MTATPERILLILDLDETLIHARRTPLERAADLRLSEYHVYKRPYLDEFIDACAASYELAVWSSASDDYATEVTQRIFPDPSILHFVWGRSRCTLPRDTVGEDGWTAYSAGHLDYVKPVHKIAAAGWPIERILIVDDTPAKARRNDGNAIYPSVYEGDALDDELPKLAAYLDTLKDCPNVRTLEKRNWRDQV